MDESFYNELRIDFKNNDIKSIKEHVSLLLYQSAQGYLRDKLRVHPLGFLFCRLHQFSNNETIRIHIWYDKENIQKPLMDIHNHFYSITSFIVVGSVSNTLYKASLAEPYTHSTYIGSYQNNERRILSKNDEYYKLEELETHIINEGELYTIGKSEVHRGDSIANFSISLVFTEDPGNPSPLVFGPIDGLSKYEYSSNLVDELQLRELENQIKYLVE
ncbi:hypothetical protein [Algoriphagus aquimarinus]|uniref:Cysteine dioxygenase n=1 Tax=Algoriphagus aquimarinus TaxID=237018 RepID=A0A5C7AB80_9BACT|nr:hypothetical protein [Algoriphagus aquimarinus]TXE03731.1 hypothetical protein ESV85_19795 [Algoriphagus aquimarinus]